MGTFDVAGPQPWSGFGSGHNPVSERLCRRSPGREDLDQGSTTSASRRTLCATLSASRPPKERPANIDEAVAPVTALFKKSKDPQHLKTLTKIRSEKALDLFIEQLDYSDENFENASVAATGILELASLDDKGREAAKKAVPELVKALDKKLPIKTRANVVKVEAMKALTAIKDPAAVPAPHEGC